MLSNLTLLLSLINILPQTFANNDPSLAAGTIALPLSLMAKRKNEELKLATDLSSTTSSTLAPITQMILHFNQQPKPATAEPLLPSTAPTLETTLLTNRRVKEKHHTFTTFFNDRPLISQLTTPIITSTIENPLTTTPSFSTPLVMPTKFALRSGKHPKHNRNRMSEDKVQSITEPSVPDDEDLDDTTLPQSTTPYEQRQRCQSMKSGESGLINSATTCKNERQNRICSLLFSDPDPKTGRRDPKCNVAGMEDIANSCRRQCGICCEHIDHACEDDENQIIDCTKQLDKCQMGKWFDVLARFCAGSCGLCTRTACRDFSVKCREMKHLCLDQANIDFMRQNCSRTCGFCVVGPGGISENPMKRLPVPACIDHATNCTENEALCSSPMHAEFMIKYCAKTCFKCTGTGEVGSQVIVPVIGTSPELNGTAAVLVPASVIMGAARSGDKLNECVDHHPKCQIWVAKGFCTHTKYTNEQRMALCPKSCNLC